MDWGGARRSRRHRRGLERLGRADDLAGAAWAVLADGVAGAASPRRQDADRAETQRPDAGPRPRVSLPADRTDQTRCAADEMAVTHRGGGAVRIALVVLGVVLGAYGALLLLENPLVIIMRILVWAL